MLPQVIFFSMFTKISQKVLPQMLSSPPYKEIWDKQPCSFLFRVKAPPCWDKLQILLSCDTDTPIQSRGMLKQVTVHICPETKANQFLGYWYCSEKRKIRLD